jgi:osmoprotectant transport system permease protein
MYTGQHVRLTLLTLAISIAIALPVGTLVARVRILYTPVLTVLGIIYTIPSFALLAVLILYVGIGTRSALIALVAYAQFVLVRNIAVGLREVDPVVVEAARGMGMSSLQILFKIEYPLALPVILGGLRIATVATIAITTIAALDDAGGLGTLLFDGVNNAQTSEIEVGAVAVSVLAIAADIILRLIDRALPATRTSATR